jgi:pyruvate kinase
MIEQSLIGARDFAGLRSGSNVVLTAGRRTGTPGGTNLVMVREVP